MNFFERRKYRLNKMHTHHIAREDPSGFSAEPRNAAKSRTCFFTVSRLHGLRLLLLLSHATLCSFVTSVMSCQLYLVMRVGPATGTGRRRRQKSQSSSAHNFWPAKETTKLARTVTHLYSAVTANASLADQVDRLIFAATASVDYLSRIPSTPAQTFGGWIKLIIII